MPSPTSIPVARNSPVWAPLQIPHSPTEPFTDYTRWRLQVSDGGRHVWVYLKTDDEMKAWPQSTVDKYWLGLDTVRVLHCRATLWSDFTDRVYQHCQKPGPHMKLRGMDMNSTSVCNVMMDTGLVNMEVRCSSCPVSSLGVISQTWRSPWRRGWR